MARQWKCPYCGSPKNEVVEQKTVGVWFVRLKCGICESLYTVTKCGVRLTQGPRIYKDTTDDELIKAVKELHSLVYQSECFNSKDLLRLEAGTTELEARGYAVSEEPELVIAKP